ncbi:hypothetical protein CLOP_g12149 [Closterium sp. NIES-67]|nr:hypothetical protein CLOP_g12149 [Closterium sp. NIES-67]
MDGGGSDDCVYFGRALERAEDVGGRKLRAAVVEGRAKQMVPVWQQEARDDAGRRRFHGAFTGGFSAGYFNTVGSKEGWEPATFRSSRSNRAERREQRVAELMDADERDDAERAARDTQGVGFDAFKGAHDVREIPAGDLHEVEDEDEEEAGVRFRGGGGAEAEGRQGQRGEQQGAPWMGGLDQARGSSGHVMRGFCEGRLSVEECKWYPPPHVPASFTPHHTFPSSPSPLSTAPASTTPAPPPAAPPVDPSLRAAVEGVAAMRANEGGAAAGVAAGKAGGSGDGGVRLGPDARGMMLGEQPLPASQPPLAWAPPTLPASAPVSAPAPSFSPPTAPAVSAFQQHGAAAELAAMMASRFQSGGHEDVKAKDGMGTERAAVGAAAAAGAGAALAGAGAAGNAAAAGEATVVARRREEAWRPLPLLCKRFNLPDPFAGKAPPHPLHRPCQLDTLTSFPQTRPSAAPTPTPPSSSPLLSLPAPPSAAVTAATAGRYGGAIFSDEEDDDHDSHAMSAAPAGIDDMAAAEAATRALARLEAGDFLEGLGEELGLQVDPGEGGRKVGGKAAERWQGGVGGVEDRRGRSSRRSKEAVKAVWVMHVVTQGMVVVEGVQLLRWGKQQVLWWL